MGKRLTPVLVGLAVVAGVARAGTIRVPEDYPSVLAAVDAAVSGDSVLVGPGTWTDRTARPVSGNTFTSCAFLKGGVTVIGTVGADVTVIDAQGSGSGFVVPITYAGYPGQWATIEGLTLRGASPGGGAVYAESSGLMTIRSCKINGLTNLSAGSAIAVLYYTAPCDLVMEDSEVSFNVASLTAGIRSEGGALDIRRCRFEGNVGRAIDFDGVSNGQDVTIQDCEFVGNLNGPVALIHDPFQTSIERNLFLQNVNPTSAGAGLWITKAVGPIRDNVFAYDSSYTSGAAGLYYLSHGGEVSGNTFAGCYCSPSSVGAALLGGELVTGSVNFHNNLIADCRGGIAVAAFGGGTIKGTCDGLWNNDGGLGDYVPDATDVFLNPQFCDPTILDFSLAKSSPYTAANNPTCGQIGALGEGCDPVSVESSSWGSIKALYR